MLVRLGNEDTCARSLLLWTLGAQGGSVGAVASSDAFHLVCRCVYVYVVIYVGRVGGGGVGLPYCDVKTDLLFLVR